LAKKRTCANLLRELRQRLGGLSQEELARRAGVSWSTINRWENGKGIPSPLAREKLAVLLSGAGLQARIAELAVKE
jgi:transcriptional regulator with XRE-family HTH domain